MSQSSIRMKQRAKTLDERVKTSELFPRIRDAELQMQISEEKYIKRTLKKAKQREIALLHRSNVPKLPPVSGPKQDLFTGHVLNKDPSCSKYMLFDEIFFPKLFDPTISAGPPHTIDNIWMLGFQHYAIQQQNKVKQRAPMQV